MKIKLGKKIECYIIYNEYILEDYNRKTGVRSGHWKPRIKTILAYPFSYEGYNLFLHSMIRSQTENKWIVYEESTGQKLPCFGKTKTDALESVVNFFENGKVYCGIGLDRAIKHSLKHLKENLNSIMNNTLDNDVII